MNRITRIQLLALLLITDVFTFFCLRDSVSVMTAAGFLAASAVQLVIALPLAAMCGKSTSMTKIGGVVCIVYLIFWGGMLFRMQWGTSGVINIPGESSGSLWGRLIISGLIAAVCLYISSTGIKAVARAAVIAAAVGALCLGIVMVNGLFSSDWENFFRAGSGHGFRYEFIRGFSVSGGLGSFAVLMSLTDGRPVGTAAAYFTAKGIIGAAVSLTAVLIAGGIMDMTDFPVVTAAQLSQPFSVQRIDALFLMIFAAFAVFAIAVQSAAAAYLLGNCFPKFRRYRCSTVLVLMIAAAFLLGGEEISGMVFAAAAAVMLLVVPTAAYIADKTKDKRSRA